MKKGEIIMVAYEPGANNGYEVFTGEAYSNNYILHKSNQVTAQEKIAEISEKMNDYMEHIKDLVERVEAYGRVFTVAEQRQNMDDAWMKLYDFQLDLNQVVNHPLQQWIENYNSNLDEANAEKALQDASKYHADAVKKADNLLQQYDARLKSAISSLNRCYAKSHANCSRLEQRVARYEQNVDDCEAVIDDFNSNQPRRDESIVGFCNTNSNVWSIPGRHGITDVVPSWPVQSQNWISTLVSNYKRPADS